MHAKPSNQTAREICKVRSCRVNGTTGAGARKTSVTSRPRLIPWWGCFTLPGKVARRHRIACGHNVTIRRVRRLERIVQGAFLLQHEPHSAAAAGLEDRRDHMQSKHIVQAREYVHAEPIQQPSLTTSCARRPRERKLREPIQFHKSRLGARENADSPEVMSAR